MYRYRAWYLLMPIHTHPKLRGREWTCISGFANKTRAEIGATWAADWLRKETGEDWVWDAKNPAVLTSADGFWRVILTESPT